MSRPGRLILVRGSGSWAHCLTALSGLPEPSLGVHVSQMLIMRWFAELDVLCLRVGFVSLRLLSIRGAGFWAGMMLTGRLPGG